MPKITLKLIDYSGKRYTIMVNNDIPVSELLDRVAQLIRRPISAIVHRGHRLNPTLRLTDLYYVNPQENFYIMPYSSVPNTRSIVNLSNYAEAVRRERLEEHLANLRSEVPRGKERRRRSNIMKTVQNAPRVGNLPYNLQRNIAGFVGGKRTRKAKKSRRATRQASRKNRN